MLDRAADFVDAEKSSPGDTPCVYRFSATFTMSRLPVRSPLPNRQPSIRSAPAISANSPAAVPVPRSLWGCTDSTIASRRARWRCIHSIMSAKILGVECSTVDGRLTMHLRCGVGCQTSRHRIHHPLGKRQLGAREHLGRILEGPLRLRLLRSQFHKESCLAGRQLDDAVLVQSQTPPCASRARRRCTGARWRRAPCRDSNVRRINGSRAWVSTWIVTSSGIRSSSIRRAGSQTRSGMPTESPPRFP
jgi:hypothetical protein